MTISTPCIKAAITNCISELSFYPDGGSYYLKQKIAKINGVNEDNILVGIEANKREDDSYGFVAAVGYTVTRWLNASVGYEYEERDSNLDNNDYTSNRVFLRLTAAL